MLTLQRLRMKGFPCFYQSHKLQEVWPSVTAFHCCDGKLISTVEKSDVTQNDLAQMMVGREMNTTAANETSPVQPEILLQISAIQALDTKGLPALKNVSFAVHPGEILGIAGVSGNGQSELAQVLSGMLQPVSGKIIFKGADITRLTPVEIVRLGIGRIPEDRHASVVGEMSVAENIVMETLNNYAPRGLLDRKRINQYAESLIAQYQIKARPQDPIRTLSGGNMQKVLLARTLARNPEVIIVSQPTRGLDVGQPSTFTQFCAPNASAEPVSS
jgi:simple sugar transport system ATP-binding protein